MDRAAGRRRLPHSADHLHCAEPQRRPDLLPWAQRPGVDRARLATGRRLRADHRRGAGERADLATA